MLCSFKGTRDTQLLLFCAGSHNHDDFIPTSSWQLQLAGAKAWHICAPSQYHAVQGADEAAEAEGLDVFAPDYARFPNLREADHCYAGVARAGELAWYPAKWFHATSNVKPWSLGLTGSIVDGDRVSDIQDTLQHNIALQDLAAQTRGIQLAFVPHSKTARDRAPCCFKWWEDGIVGAYEAPHSDADQTSTCGRGDLQSEVGKLRRLMQENANEDAVFDEIH